MNAGQRFSVTIEPAALVFEATANLPLLRSAREAGLILPSSCRNGTCRACLCRLVRGRVSYIVEWPGLSAEEKAEGFILPCVAVPESAVVLDSAKVLDLRAES